MAALLATASAPAQAGKLSIQLKWPCPDASLLGPNFAHLEVVTKNSHAPNGASEHYDFLGDPKTGGSEASLHAEIPLTGDGTLQIHFSLTPTLKNATGTVLEFRKSYRFHSEDGQISLESETNREANERSLVLVSRESQTPDSLSLNINTTFIDVTDLWKVLSEADAVVDPTRVGLPSDRQLFENSLGADAWKKLRAVMHFGGKPLLWFVAVPKQLHDSGPAGAIHRMVFFRPTNYPYKGLTDRQHKLSGMFQLNRYLLSGRPLTPSEQALRTSTDPSDRNRFKKVTMWESDHWENVRNSASAAMPGNWPRAGMLRSLERTGKRVIVLQPWLQNGGGDAVTAKLPGISENITHFLWSQSRITPTAPYQEGKLVLAGYSYGGAMAWEAFGHASPQIDEFYSLDAIFQPSQRDGGKIGVPYRFVRETRDWAQNHVGAKLRIAWGFGNGLDIWGGLLNTLKSESTAQGFDGTLLPESESFWAPVARGGSPWYNGCIKNVSLHEHANEMMFHRHDFCIFGGPGANADGGSETFLETFLRQSALN